MSESNCCICLNELNYKTEKETEKEKRKYTNISTTICNHTFHTSCLLQCKNIKCPICRSPMYEECEEKTLPVSRQHLRSRPSQVDEQVVNTLVDEYYDEFNDVVTAITNIINTYLKKFVYVVVQIIVVLALIFNLNILTSIILIFPYKGYTIVNEYLFKSAGH